MGNNASLLTEAFKAFDAENWSEAEQLYRRAIKEAEGQNERYLNNALHMLAFTLAMKEAFRESLLLYERLLAKAQNASDEAIALHQIGMVYRMEKKYDKAIASFNKEKKLRVNSLRHDYVGFSANSYEFGQIAFEKEELQEAFTHFTEALDYGKSAYDQICIGCAHRGLGTYFDKVGAQNKAMQSFEKSISAFEEAGDSGGAEQVRGMLKIIERGI